MQRDLLGGGCRQTCPPGGNCDFTCSGRDCQQGCEGDAECKLTCSGGGCCRAGQGGLGNEELLGDDCSESALP